MHPHRAWAEIDLDAFAGNLREIRRRIGRRGVILVVKADAYGHGAIPLVHHAIRCGVEAFGVGDSHEALELRESGVRAPILILGTIVEGEERAVVEHGIEVAIHAADRIRSLRKTAAAAGRSVGVHLNLDTGMGRLGVFPERAPVLLEEIRRSKGLRLAGIMSHLSSPQGWRDPFTAEQVERFERFLELAALRGGRGPRVHLANSAGVFTGLPDLHDAVRPGIAAYGVLPRRLAAGTALRPVLSLRTQVVFLKDVPAGTSVGYDRLFVTSKATRIATVPLGYHDGLPWRLGGRGEVLVRGVRVPIVGAVSMDYATLDVGKVHGVRVGDTVTVIGRDGAEEIAAEEIAERLGTIPCEIVCGIGKRVRRVLVGGEGNWTRSVWMRAAGPRRPRNLQSDRSFAPPYPPMPRVRTGL
ncbi:MAG TPA: alanine racemase [Planctomycetota bacterium]|jgi:alanine racemase|nr:alanine racemase [Planctomycetota bacterium]